MRTGKRWVTVDIERLTETADTFGEPDPTWSLHLVRQAVVKPATGTEFFRQGTPVVEGEYHFEFRYDSDVAALTARDRIAYNGQYYDIKSLPMNVRNENREVHLLAVLQQ